MMTWALVGIGQSLRGDDAAGLEAVRYWQTAHADLAADPALSVIQAELPGLQLLEWIQGAEVAILVDAVQSRASPPGTVHVLRWGGQGGFDAGSGTAHGWGVAETLALGRRVSPANMPAEIVLVGIEAAQFDLGQPLSPEVAAAIPRAADRIHEIVLRLRGA